MSNFWDHLNTQKAMCQGKQVAGDTKHLGLKHGVWQPGECGAAAWGYVLPQEGVSCYRVLMVHWYSQDQHLLAASFENFPTSEASESTEGHFASAQPVGHGPKDESAADTGALVPSMFTSPERLVGKAVDFSAEAPTA